MRRQGISILDAALRLKTRIDTNRNQARHAKRQRRSNADVPLVYVSLPIYVLAPYIGQAAPGTLGEVVLAGKASEALPGEPGLTVPLY